MGRLPFDPKRAIGPAKMPPGEIEEVGRATPAQLTVTEVSSLIRSTLEERIPSPLRIVGQVSNLKTPGHWYFSLKDDEAVLSCLAWASSARTFGFTPTDGDEVVVTGHVSHYPAQGRTQFYASAMQPVGAGALELQFRALCTDLRARGYFDDATKTRLPLVPRCVAVITSVNGAAIHDVIATAAQRCPAVRLALIDARVQGDGAAEDIASAIQWVDAHARRMGIDAVLVTRGGGSIEDLWAFNERIVADAAFACTLPLVAAIGHESDTTIIELVADVRASTPTQAAMLLIPSADGLRQQVDHLAHRLRTLARRRVEHERNRIDRLAQHELLGDPRGLTARERDWLRSRQRRLRLAHRALIVESRLRVERTARRLGRPGESLLSARQSQLAVLTDRIRRASGQRLTTARTIAPLHDRLIRGTERRFADAANRLRTLSLHLDAVDPLNVLARGYSMTWSGSGTLLRSAADAESGDILRTRLADGEVHSVVSRSDGPASSGRPGAPGPPRRRSRRRSDNADQMDLFGGSE